MLTSTTNKVQYSISYPFGSTFPVTFKYWLAAEIHAVLSFPTATGKDDQELVLNTDFSLTPPGDTGTLTRLSDWDHDAERLTIYRLLDIDQQTDYRNGEATDMDLLEQDFDRATARMQQLDEKSDRHLIVAITDPPADLSLPSVAARASKFLAFDTEGLPVAAEGVASVPVTEALAALLDDPTIAASRITLDVYSKAESDALKKSQLIKSLSAEASVSVADILCHYSSGYKKWATPDNATEFKNDEACADFKVIKVAADTWVAVYSAATSKICVRARTIALGWGTPVQVASTARNIIDFDIDVVDSYKFVVAARGITPDGRAHVGSVSGNTITLGTIHTFAAYDATHVRVAAVSTSAFIISWVKVASAFDGYGEIAIFSGLTVTGVTAYNLDSGTQCYRSACVAMDSTHALFVYDEGTSLYFVHCVISGSTMPTRNNGNISCVSRGSGGTALAICKINSILALVQFSRATTFNIGFAAIRIITGDLPKAGVAINLPNEFNETFLGANTFNSLVAVDGNMAVAAYAAREGGNLGAIILGIHVNENQAILQIEQCAYINDELNANTPIAISKISDDEILISYQKASGYASCISRLIPRVVGVAKTAGTTPDVVIAGIAAGFSSLVPGEIYYLNPNAEVVRYPTFERARIGRAISDTEIMVGR